MNIESRIRSAKKVAGLALAAAAAGALLLPATAASASTGQVAGTAVLAHEKPVLCKHRHKCGHHRPCHRCGHRHHGCRGCGHGHHHGSWHKHKDHDWDKHKDHDWDDGDDWDRDKDRDWDWDRDKDRDWDWDRDKGCDGDRGRDCDHDWGGFKDYWDKYKGRHGGYEKKWGHHDHKRCPEKWWLWPDSGEGNKFWGFDENEDDGS
ncbi:hypothetical protein OUY22_25785 [Nonomuraea sp. MCN248]|uniref:Uncharacterized protein n=1 Tax=Nonomuraea corallina TaxID=2989783 RepID=A0ABT4SI96_9ACTN|nr:hypothetical protein [Nonomuraea corallina]MDA0636835.1 hypothetical protein [Nonomuraea corallina]